MTTESTAMTTTTGAGASVHHRRLVPRNKEGLSYREWLNTAGVSSSTKHFKMWRQGKNPCDVGAGGAEDNPTGGMSTSAKIAIGVAGALAVVGIVTAGVVMYKKHTAANAGPSWKRSKDGTIPAGAQARVAIAASAIQPLLPFVTNDQALKTLVEETRMLTNVSAWGPGDDPGWKFSDDANPAGEFHAAFKNASGNMINLNSGFEGLPSLPWQVWVYA